MLARVDQTSADIAAVETRIEELIGPFAAAVAQLDEIPGVGITAAHVMVAEIGAEMSRFPTPAHLCSWARSAPGVKESAGKNKGRGATGHGNPYLGEVAVTAGKTDTFLGERYRRLARGRGKKKAIVAVGRSALVIVWHLLSDPEARFHGLGSALLVSLESHDVATRERGWRPDDIERVVALRSRRAAHGVGERSADASAADGGRRSRAFASASNPPWVRRRRSSTSRSCSRSPKSRLQCRWTKSPARSGTGTHTFPASASACRSVARGASATRRASSTDATAAPAGSHAAAPPASSPRNRTCRAR
jgi:hypothetical protein